MFGPIAFQFGRMKKRHTCGRVKKMNPSLALFSRKTFREWYTIVGFRESPNGIAYRDGFLYVAEISQVHRFAWADVLASLDGGTPMKPDAGVVVGTLVERFDPVKFGIFQRNLSNFRGLVLFCIEADFCNQILIF